MKTLRLLTAAALLLAGALAFAAATPPPAFTAAGNTCADITWKQETVAKYPNVADACQGVVQRNGETYVKFVGVVQRVTPSTMRVKFKGSDRSVNVRTANVPKIVLEDGTKLRPQDVAPGQELTVYMPSDRFVADFETDQPDQLVTAEIIDVTMDEPIRTAAAEPAPEALPRTATQWPLVAALGLMLTAIAAGLTLARRRRLIAR
jgi:LPXTG-motif cell wall-anchored protein